MRSRCPNSTPLTRVNPPVLGATLLRWVVCIREGALPTGQEHSTRCPTASVPLAQNDKTWYLDILRHTHFSRQRFLLNVAHDV